jgi:hypothetical protein
LTLALNVVRCFGVLVFKVLPVHPLAKIIEWIRKIKFCILQCIVSIELD